MWEIELAGLPDIESKILAGNSDNMEARMKIWEKTDKGEPVPAAFFDVDNTLIQGDTQEMEARFILAAKLHSPLYLWQIMKTLGALWMNRIGLLPLSRQNEVYLNSYKGMSKGDLEELGLELFDKKVKQRFFSGAMEMIKTHRDKGHLIALVSATTRHLLLPFEPVIKPDILICTDLEFDKRSRATGRAENGICAQEKKQILIRSFAKERGLDLGGCYAYSDHHSDIPMLEAVGRPAVINPTQRLAAHAQKRGWQVHHFKV